MTGMNSTAPQSSRVVAVTGAGTGIGRATARAFAVEGAHAVAIGRRAEPLKETAAGHDRITAAGRRHHLRGRAGSDHPDHAGDTRPAGRAGQQCRHRAQRRSRHADAGDDHSSACHQPRRPHPIGPGRAATPGEVGRGDRQCQYVGGAGGLARQLCLCGYQDRSGAADPAVGRSSWHPAGSGWWRSPLARSIPPSASTRA